MEKFYRWWKVKSNIVEDGKRVTVLKDRSLLVSFSLLCPGNFAVEFIDIILYY
jgi:hypothetical protein